MPMLMPMVVLIPTGTGTPAEVYVYVHLSTGEDKYLSYQNGGESQLRNDTESVFYGAGG